MWKLYTRSVAAALLTSTAQFVPFEPGKPGWKMNEAGDAIAVDADGNPIYVHADGTEGSIKSTTIAERNAEAQRNRVRAETAEEKLKAFDGLDPVKAKEALETVGKLDAKQLIDAGEVDRVKGEIKKGFETQLADKDKAIDGLNSKLSSTHLGLAFNGSKFIADKLAIPADIVRATFGGNFKVDPETGKITAIASDGNPVMSKKNLGNPADFEEALEMIVENYPHKDAIMKGNNQGGSGNNGGGGNNNAGKKVYRRAEFDQMPASQKATIAEQAGKGEVVIQD